MYLSANELKETFGGMSGNFLGYFIRGIQLVYQFGQSAGSAVRRFLTGNLC